MSNLYNVAVVTPPATQVLTLAQAKLHLRVDGTDDDTLITTLISSAQEYAESYTNRRFITQTLQLYIDNFYDWTAVDNSLPNPWYQYLKVPYPPCQAIQSIQYLDTNSAWQTLSTSIYQVDVVSEPARIYHAYNQGFPLVQQTPQSVKIMFTCGYGGASAVPASIQQAMLILIGHWYDNRSIYTDTRLAELPLSVDALLSRNRIMDI